MEMHANATHTANATTESIFPSANAFIGLDGIIFCIVSKRLVKLLAWTSLCENSMLTPLPKFKNLGNISPIPLAATVVHVK